MPDVHHNGQSVSFLLLVDKAIKAARLADEIRDHIAMCSRRDLPGYLFSISQATLSLDMSEALVWVEVLNTTQQVAILEKLHRLRVPYQRKLNQLPGKFAFIKIRFVNDDSAQLNDRFDKLLKS